MFEEKDRRFCRKQKVSFEGVAGEKTEVKAKLLIEAWK